MIDHLLEVALLMALCPAPSVLVLFLVWRKRQTNQAGKRTLLQQTRRRPPGESLRVQLARLDEEICEWLVYLAICPALLGLSAALITLPGLVMPALLFSGSLIWTSVCAWKLRQLNRQGADLELAFDGRRLVAEELNRLVAEGFEVYHDIPYEGFTLDHILLGPPGLFAVETKVDPRPGKTAASQPERAEFDGFRVNWPTCAQSYGLENAVARARVLEQWLSGALGETVAATPVLILPGWAIEYTTANQAVLVLNEKQIGRICDSKAPRLTEDLIRRACHHLNQRSASTQSHSIPGA